MKTNPLFRKTLHSISYIFVLLWTAFSSFGQCPTIAVTNPPPICDASGFTFNDLNTFALKLLCLFYLSQVIN